jgi:hypothetical protein
VEQEEQAVTDAYDMRSNIKGKPGSQGTLFQVKDKGLLNPQQRWPQGYTPERLNDVRQGLRATPVTPPAHLGVPGDTEHATERMGYRERLVRSVAKSTVPAEHLPGIKEIHADVEEGTKGTYWPTSRNLAVDMTIPGRDKTLIHEIGHHADNWHDNQTARHLPDVAAAHAQKDWPHDTPPNTTAHYQAQAKTSAGVAEAVADNYYEQHYRTGGRKSQGVTGGLYESTFTSDRLNQHYPGYTDVRPTPPSPSLAALQEAQFNPGLFSRAAARGEVTRSPLQRRLAARADANQRAVGDNH